MFNAKLQQKYQNDFDLVLRCYISKYFYNLHSEWFENQKSKQLLNLFQQFSLNALSRQNMQNIT